MKYLVKYFSSFLFAIFAFLFLTQSVFAATYTLSGKLTDGQGHYLGFAQIRVLNPNTGTEVVGTTSNTSTGNYSVSINEGTYNIQITPPYGNAYQTKTLTSVVITGNTQLNITLDPSPGSIVLSGRIISPNNQPIPDISTGLSYTDSNNGGVAINYVTDSSGVYFLRVFPRSDYTFLLNYSGTASNSLSFDIPGTFRVTNYPLTLTQDITQDIVIPTVHVTVHVQDPNGNPVPNASVSFPELTANFFQSNIGQMQGKSGPPSVATNSNGDVLLRLLPSGPGIGSYIITAYPNSGSYFDNRIIVNDEIVDGLSFTISLSTMPTLWGRFVGQNVLSNQTVELKQNDSVITSLLTDEGGNYYVKVPIGNYTFIAHSNGKIPNGPTFYTISGDLDLSISKNVNIGINNDRLGTVNVKVRDSAYTTTSIASHVIATGPPVSFFIPGLTNVTGTSNDENDTDSAGNARLYLFNTGSSINGYTITATPFDSNYLPNSINNYLLNGGQETTIYVTANHPPTADAGGPYSINEGDSVALNGSGSDLDNDSLTYSWDLDNNGTFETSGQNVIFSATNLDGPDIKTVNLRVCDIYNACDTSQTTASILNVAPTAQTIVAPTDPVAVNTSIFTSADFTDPGTLDTHTAIWDWGDGTTSSGIVSETNGSITGNHTYLATGVYTIQLTVTDNNGDSGTSQFQYVVVYDSSPTAGFLTGSGGYDSQAGWYLLDTQATGKLKFGIQAKYTSGTTLVGQTRFNFKDANLDFASTFYQWLVISDAKATLKGNGTINGSGNYTFLATAIDGSQTGGDNLIRIQIKDSFNNVIYDTQSGAADTADPTTPLSYGLITVH